MDENGNVLRDGVCGPECLTHEDTLNWLKDETLKMTLQYNHNPVLMAGLEWYGILSSCFLLYSVILTASITAIGKYDITVYHNSFNFSSHDDFQVGEVRAQYPPCRKDGQDGQDLEMVHQPFL